VPMSSFVGWLRRSTVLLAAAALFSVTAPLRAEVDPLIGIRVAEALSLIHI